MEVSALAEPQAIKVSSKRQITIPAKLYKELNFDEYALCTWTNKGLLIQPLDVEDEDITVGLLREILEEGYVGDDLIEEYKKRKQKFGSLVELMVKRTDEALKNPEKYGVSFENPFKD